MIFAKFRGILKKSMNPNVKILPINTEIRIISASYFIFIRSINSIAIAIKAHKNANLNALFTAFPASILIIGEPITSLLKS